MQKKMKTVENVLNLWIFTCLRNFRKMFNINFKNTNIHIDKVPLRSNSFAKPPKQTLIPKLSVLIGVQKAQPNNFQLNTKTYLRKARI